MNSWKLRKFCKLSTTAIIFSSLDDFLYIIINLSTSWCYFQFQEVETVLQEQTEDDKKREFELADVLDYIKTGVEAIIEDQVTSRFEAQELKVSWMVATCRNQL